MQINLFNTSRIFSQQTKINKNDLTTNLQNKISVTNKGKKTNDNDIINKGLDKIDDEKGTDNQREISDLVYGIKKLYEPLEDNLQYLSKQADIYDKDTNELEKSDLSEDERTKIQSDLNATEATLKDGTSPKAIAKWDNIISTYIDPKLNELKSIFKDVLSADNLNISSFSLKSMANLGFSADKNTDFNTIIEQIKNASTIMKGKTLELDKIDKEYGDSTNENRSQKVDMYA